MQRHHHHAFARTAIAIAVCSGSGSGSGAGALSELADLGFSVRHAVVAACTFEISGSGKEVKLLPVGRFSARDGRPGGAGWLINGDIARRVIERAASRETDIVVDYEHQTIHAEWNGQPAPAAGWFSGSGLVWRDGDGLYATDVRWTERARAMIDAGEYRYVSPVFAYLPDSGEVLEILHVALTNDPALDALPALAEQAAARYSRSTDRPEEGDATVDKLKELLGLAQNATEDQVQHALVALKAKLAETLVIEQNATPEAVAEALAALKTKADQVDTKDQEIAALKSGNPDPSKYAPVETVEQLRTEIATLRTAHNDREVDELVQAGLADGRILPAQETWARELGGKDVATLKTYLESTQPIAALKGTQTGGQPPAGGGNADGELTDTQKAVCRSMGLSEEAYKKQLGIGGGAHAAGQ